MTNTFEIRPLGRLDRAGWGALWRDYLAFYGAERPQTLYDTTFARFIDPDRTDMCAWMAWDGDNALGLVHTIAHAHGWQDAPVTYLQDLFTAKPARGRGVARALIETVYADADASGRPSVYWLTQTGNITARALYDRIGQPTDFMKYSRGSF
ncbi:GNAT family N-acetyltransferase [Gymnodinialimonas sp. 2305UL16-5]|uniref:GNAT family N-acetyltransferase n=1 Tax=Gymnodinialimonas mytili TaxID=3126503 RepID=UPI00309DED69